MRWRTDIPTADVIVAYVKGYNLPIALKKEIEWYIDNGRTPYPIDVIEKWADLEEDETVTNCHQLDEAAEKFARSYDQGTCDGIAQDCFKAGANWQKEQLKEEAIVGEIVDPEYLWRIIGDTPSDILFKRGFRDGDLVRVNVSRLSDNA